MTNDPEATGGLGTFERYLSLWVALCMAAGIGLGKLLPSAVAAVRSLEFGHASRINAPIAALIWLMITPMMMKVDFSSLKNESDVEQKLIYPLLVAELPFGFGIPANEIVLIGTNRKASPDA